MAPPRQRTRVLWLAKGLGPGGMERLLVNHARVGDRDAFDYRAAYLVERPGSVVPELEELDVECTRLGGDAGGSDPRWVLDLRRLVRAEGIDVVHAHSPLPAALARPALRSMRGRPKLVYTEHNTWDCYGRATRLANLVTYALDDAQLAVSADAAASPPKALGRRVEVLTHGIDLAAVAEVARERGSARDQLGVAPDAVVVLAIANLRAEKAYDVLLDAARAVLDEHPEVVFLSAGHGPLRDELERRRDELGLGDGFRFLGFRDDAMRLLAAADVFTLSSRQEGLPVSYMESTALGVPAVVTAVGGLPDFVVDGVNGLLVEPEQPAALATALCRVVGDAQLRRRLAEGARDTARRFDAAVAVRHQEAMYRRLVA